ncbi:GntR family transcriptional regulator [Alcaligenaceae bacterium 429]|nr:GntR family transcriptional regulator [Alcaligenaceae bacterium 429]
MTGNQTNAEAAAERLREAILSGELQPGEKLHQNQVAEMLGVSRTPLRTALSMLAQSGLVVYESNKGFHVREYSPAHIRHAFVVRAELEALACKLAADNMTEERAEDLHNLVVEGDRLLASETLLPEHHAAYRQMNVSFHGNIMEYAANPWVKEMIDQIYNVPLISDRVIIWKSREIFIRTHDDHHRIARALANRDGARASAIMREHVSFSIEYMLSQLQEHTDLAGSNHGKLHHIGL